MYITRFHDSTTAHHRYGIMKELTDPPLDLPSAPTEALKNRFLHHGELVSIRILAPALMIDFMDSTDDAANCYMIHQVFNKHFGPLSSHYHDDAQRMVTIEPLDDQFYTFTSVRLDTARP